MNRKQKIIISITGILLVTLILAGLTYAYFLTRIQGNTNTRSISVDTANLSLTYGDGNGSIITATKITPGTVVGTKTFTVTNTGNVDNGYLVVLDNVSVTYVSTFDNQIAGTATTFESNDFVYTLTCTSSDSNSCNEVTNETTLPIQQGNETKTVIQNGILITNSIAPSTVHTYTITVTYKETGIDQSDDMNKALSARINIKDIKQINPYTSGTLAYNIINNAMLNKNGTELRATPLTRPAEEVSTATEKELSITPDDYGTSYYYRGGVEDNYVNFAGMCWRIVRIDGEGNIKIILEDQDIITNGSPCASSNGNWDIGTGNFGYTYYGSGELTASDGITTNSNYLYAMDYLHGDSSSMAYAFKNFQTNTLSSYLNKLESGNWCMNDKGYSQSGSSGNYTYTELSVNEMLDRKVNGQTFDYDSYVRLNNKTPKEPTLKCNGTVMNDWNDNLTNPTPMYVATLTADEIVYAGGKYNTSNQSYYLINRQSLTFWSLSPNCFYYDRDYAFYVSYNGSVNDDDVNVSNSFRPSVSLKSGTTISGGDGTKANAYTVN